jgi:hypothetical protein
MHAIHGRRGTKRTVCEREEDACPVVTADVCRVLEILSRLTTNDFVALPCGDLQRLFWPLKRPVLDCGLR